MAEFDFAFEPHLFASRLQKYHHGYSAITSRSTIKGESSTFTLYLARRSRPKSGESDQ